MWGASGEWESTVCRCWGHCWYQAVHLPPGHSLITYYLLRRERGNRHKDSESIQNPESNTYLINIFTTNTTIFKVLNFPLKLWGQLHCSAPMKKRKLAPALSNTSTWDWGDWVQLTVSRLVLASVPSILSNQEQCCRITGEHRCQPP